MREHVCTKKCLRWETDFGRRFYYCALQKPVSVRVKRWTLERPPAFLDPLEQLELGRG